MKKRNILFLAVLPLCLASCGGSNEPTSLPNTGTVMTKEAGRQVLEDSTEATLDTGAVGFSISDTTLTLSIVNTMVIAGTTTETDADFTLNNFDVNFGFKGLTSTNLDDIKGSATISANLTTSFKMYSYTDSSKKGDPTGTSNNSVNLSAGVYVDKDYAYYDFSGLASAISSIADLGLVSSDAKGKTQTGFSADMLPLMSEDTVAAIKDELASIDLEDIEGEFRDHGDDTYSVSETLTGEEINKTIKDATSGQSEETSEEISSSLNDIIGNYSADATITASGDSSIAYALIFNKDSLSSLGFKVHVNATVGATGTASSDASIFDNVASMAYSSTTTVSLDYQFKTSFLTGDKVTVDTVTNPDSYPLTDSTAA